VSLLTRMRDKLRAVCGAWYIRVPPRTAGSSTAPGRGEYVTTSIVEHDDKPSVECTRKALAARQKAQKRARMSA